MRRDHNVFVALPLVGLLLLAAAAPVLAEVEGTLQINQSRLQGTGANGQLLLFSPDPVQPGSSISHWDPSATPNLLMEPFLGSDLPFLGLDITPGQMQDVGWELGDSTINIFSFDPPGTGFTDPRPFAGAPGNPAATFGEARMNLFDAVLGAWAGTLESPVDIDVVVLWLPLFCEGGAAVLGAAGTLDRFFDVPGGIPGVVYHAALAEALAGVEATGTPMVDADGYIVGGDLFVLMNSSLDDECLGPGTGWYYGLDGDNPPNQLDQGSVVLHELAHGLGFSNFTDEETGELIAPDLPSIYDLFTLDLTTGKHWDEMTDAERRESARNFRKVVWSGAEANAAAQPLLDPGVPELVISDPPSIAGTYEVGTAFFGPPIPAGGLSGEIACMKDGVPDSTLLNGCTAATNPGELAGKIALIDRGGCAFTTKVENAEAAGAIGAIIVNNAGNNAFNLGGDDPGIGIPSVMVGSRDGRLIREQACGDSAAFLQNERFQVTAQWMLDDGTSGEARAVELTPDTTYFWFFRPSNVEMVVKVLDACNSPNFNSFWVFAGGLTNVEVTLTVTDTQTGDSKVYFKPFGPPFPPIQDTRAFLTCP